MTFKEKLIEDMQEIKENESENRALQQIDEIFWENCLDCGSIGLPISTNVQMKNHMYNANEQAIKGWAKNNCWYNFECSAVSDDNEEKLFRGSQRRGEGYGKTFIYYVFYTLSQGKVSQH